MMLVPRALHTFLHEQGGSYETLPGGFKNCEYARHIEVGLAGGGEAEMCPCSRFCIHE